MKEFRLVIYMNAPLSRGFYGARNAASPLAYSYHTKQRKVFLGGPIKLKGLGKYHDSVKDALKPLALPKDLCSDGEQIRISDTAFIYQNDDPLLSNTKSGIYWLAKIDKIGLPESFSKEDKDKFTLEAVKIGRQAELGGKPDNRAGEPRILASHLYKLERPLDMTKLKVFKPGSDETKRFWDDGKLGSPYQNAFVHMTSDEWEKFDAEFEIKSKMPEEVKIEELIDSQIKHCHISESLVHEMLKIMFASKGWWVNYELLIRGKEGGRIDFLIKRDLDDDWRLIEVKLDDNPNAVTQLDGYIKSIKHEVRKLRKSNYWNSHFWPLWKEKCYKKIKGVILCKFPGDETAKEARKNGYDVWTYKYNVKQNILGIEVCDQESKKPIL